MTISNRTRTAAGAVLINSVAAFSLLSAPPALAEPGCPTGLWECISASQCQEYDAETMCALIWPGCTVLYSVCAPGGGCPQGYAYFACLYDTN